LTKTSLINNILYLNLNITVNFNENHQKNCSFGLAVFLVSVLKLTQH